MRVALREINRDVPFVENEHLLPLIGQERRDRILRLKNDRLKTMQLFSELTMLEEASKDLLIPVGFLRIKKTPLGKPYIEGYPEYYISVSHCDGMILFASCTSPIGIDIEKRRENHEKISERFFTENECEKIKNAHVPADEFLLVWTRKESFVKMTGEGLKTPLDSFDVYEKNNYVYKTDSVISKMTGESYIYSYVYRS